MRKFVATVAIAASAAATVVVSPLAAHAAGPFGHGKGELRTNCANGLSVTVSQGNDSVNESLVPGSETDLDAGSRAFLTFNIVQPAGQETYGPGLSQDSSFPGMVQRVEKAVVNLDGGRQMVFFNDKANLFTFQAISAFHVYYECGSGRS